MGIIKAVNGISPSLPDSCFIADNAVITGDVMAGKNCSFWFNSVTRGDVNSIRIGEFTNIQDGAIIHCTYKKAATEIGNYVSIGHNAIVHGCTIEDGVLIGMGAIVMDHAHVGENAIIAAGAVVLENTVIEPNTIYAGIPARKVKESSPEMSERMRQTARNYVMYGEWYSKETGTRK